MNYQDHILTIIYRADTVKTAAAKRKNILEAVYALKRVRRHLKDDGLLDEHSTELAELREQLEATALRANLPSDLEGRITKPKPPKREYVYRRTSPINHALWRLYNSEKVPSDLE